MTSTVNINGKAYNDGAYDAVTNPYGLANGGNKFNFVQSMIDVLVAASAGFVGGSATSLAVGTGSKSFTLSSAIAFQPTMNVRAFSNADTTKTMTGTVTSCAGTALVLNITDTTGSGTAADWTIYAMGAIGPADTTTSAFALAMAGKLTGTITSGTTSMTARRRYRITGGQGDLPTMVADDFVDVELAAAAGVTVTIGRNSQTIDGVAANDTYTGTGRTPYPVVRYKYSAAGAVISALIGGLAS